MEGSGMCCLDNQGKSALRLWIEQVTVRHQCTSTALHGSNSEILTVKSCLMFFFLSSSFVPMVRFLLVLTFTSCALFHWCMYKVWLVFRFSLLILLHTSWKMATSIIMLGDIHIPRQARLEHLNLDK